MKKFSGRYEVLAEAALNRFQQGGFLIGDHVKIKKSALNNEYIKGMSEQYKQRIKEFMDSDVNLRVCAVKTTYPDTSFSVVGSPDNPTGAFLDVVQEISPANWVNPTTIPMDAVEYIDNDFYEEVPDSLKRMSPDPTEFDKDGTAKGDMGADDYMRMSKDLNLATKNTKLANSNKWDDNKPGGGNTKGVTKPKKLNDSVKVSDEKILAEAYTNILNESEAIAGAKPVVNTPSKATPESISKKLGIDVTTADPAALEDAIKRVYPKATPEQIQGVIPRIQAFVKSKVTPTDVTVAPEVTPTEVTTAPEAKKAVTTLADVNAKLGKDVSALTPEQLTAELNRVFPGQKPEKIQAAVQQIQQLSKSAAPEATTWKAPEGAPEGAKEGGWFDINNVWHNPDQADDIEARARLANEPGIDEPGGYLDRTGQRQPLTAKDVMNPQERRPDDQRFAALMDLRKQQMANDQQNTQDRIWQQGARDRMTNNRLNRGNDRDAGYQSYLQQQNQRYSQPGQQGPGSQQYQWGQQDQQGQWGQQAQPINNTGQQRGYNAYQQSQSRPQELPQQAWAARTEEPVGPTPHRNPMHTMRTDPATQAQDWEPNMTTGKTPNFGGQFGNILQNTGLNTAEAAGGGLANSIGGAVGNVVGNVAQGLGNRAYDWAGGSKNPDRNDSRYNPGNQTRGGGQRSRYQSMGGMPRQR